MYRFIILASLFITPAFAAEPIVVNSGDRQTAVLELYTSEGCNSCPRADKWLSRLVETPQDDLDVLALAFHVDYWNYLGWTDRFSDAAYTQRQRMLGANNLQRTIYTPEFFVNGKEARGAGNILDMIEQSNRTQAPLQLQMTVSRDGSELVVELHSPPQRDTVGQIEHRYLVYENSLSTDVKRGENRGKTLHHDGVVRYMSRPQGLQIDNRHRIAIDPDWQGENVGVAVMVTSPGDVHFVQAVHTPVATLLGAQ